jgi:hypothetical protein
LTVVDPLVASVLGVIFFGERLDHGPVILTGEFLALGALLASVVWLSKSPLVHSEIQRESAVALPSSQTSSSGGLGRGDGQIPMYESSQHPFDGSQSSSGRLNYHRFGDPFPVDLKPER